MVQVPSKSLVTNDNYHFCHGCAAMYAQISALFLALITIGNSPVIFGYYSTAIIDIEMMIEQFTTLQILRIRNVHAAKLS